MSRNSFSTRRSRPSCTAYLAIVLIIAAAVSLTMAKWTPVTDWGVSHLDERLTRWTHELIGIFCVVCALVLGMVGLVRHRFQKLEVIAVPILLIFFFSAYYVLVIWWPTSELLVLAVENNYPDEVKRCIRYGVDVNERVIYSNKVIAKTPMEAAIEKGDLYVIDLLLKAGANPNARRYGKSLFYHAKSWEVRDRLIAVGLDIKQTGIGEHSIAEMINYPGNKSLTEQKNEILEFLSRGVEITDKVRLAAMNQDNGIAKWIESIRLAEGAIDYDPKWIFYSSMVLKDDSAAIQVMEKYPRRLASFGQTEIFAMVVRFGDEELMERWLKVAEESKKYFRARYVKEKIESKASLAERLGRPEIAKILREQGDSKNKIQ